MSAHANTYYNMNMCHCWCRSYSRARTPASLTFNVHFSFWVDKEFSILPFFYLHAACMCLCVFAKMALVLGCRYNKCVCCDSVYVCANSFSFRIVFVCSHTAYQMQSEQSFYSLLWRVKLHSLAHSFVVVVVIFADTATVVSIALLPKFLMHAQRQWVELSLYDILIYQKVLWCSFRFRSNSILHVLVQQWYASVFTSSVFLR